VWLDDCCQDALKSVEVRFWSGCCL